MARPPTPETSTVWSRHGEEIDEGSHPVALWLRRAMLTAMASVVLAGLLSLLGVHTSTTSAEGNGYDLTLSYPVSRAGRSGHAVAGHRHPSRRPGQAGHPRVTGDYFNIFETQGFHPEPADETRDAHTLYLTFTAPPGDTFVVDFDAYIQPASQQGRSAPSLSSTAGSRWSLSTSTRG